MINKLRIILLIMIFIIMPCDVEATETCPNCDSMAIITGLPCGYWYCGDCESEGSHVIISKDGCVETCMCGLTIGEHNYEIIGTETENEQLPNGQWIAINIAQKKCTGCGQEQETSEIIDNNEYVITCPCSACEKILGFGSLGYFLNCEDCRFCSCGICLTHNDSCSCSSDSGYEECNHNYIQCNKSHCGETYCLYCEEHNCDGDHNYTTCTATHCKKYYCTKCEHDCGGGCTYTTCSEVHCKKYYCTKCGHTCEGGHKSSGVWEVNGIKHVIYCSVSGCQYEFNSHTENFGDWRSEGILNHVSTCQNGCTISKRETHNFSNTDNGRIQALAPEKVEYHTKHNVICDKCEAQALYDHIDDDDYVCDLCDVILYNISYSPATLTNQDVIVKLNVYRPGQEVEIYTYTFTKNGEYTFNLTDPAYDITVKVDWINKTLKGRVVYSPMKVTSEPVNIYFIPDFEGYDKQIFVSVNGENEQEVLNGDKYTYTLDKNARIEFNVRDSLGNRITMPANVSWIVSSNKTTISNTYYVMQGGTMFTNILVKAESEWSLDDVNNIDITVRDKDTGEVITNEVKTIMDVTNYYTRETISDYSILPKGIYYIRLGIGGANVFETGTYEVEINAIDNASLHFSGKNKVEVEVYSLIDLT